MNGADTCKLTVLADTPAKDFWSVIVYSMQTRGFVEGANRGGRSSIDRPGMERHADGSYDIYFGPSAPGGYERNWLETVPGKGWFVAFRVYAPLEPWIEKTWRPGEIELVK
ncbi:MAG: DUF1214 domain-containing protein [Verrucomicrobiales bacterium]|nr:DUF1214 domain-containing protein [Verrucomicrobiales bacterium]